VTWLNGTDVEPVLVTSNHGSTWSAVAPDALVRYCTVSESWAAAAGSAVSAAHARPAAVHTAIAVRTRVGTRSFPDTVIPFCGG
jgi:hypothetical protein